MRRGHRYPSPEYNLNNCDADFQSWITPSSKGGARLGISTLPKAYLFRTLRRWQAADIDNDALPIRSPAPRAGATLKSTNRRIRAWPTIGKDTSTCLGRVDVNGVRIEAVRAPPSRMVGVVQDHCP